MVKVIQLSSGITLGGKATACMLHVHYATLVTYANPHPQFMFEPKYYMNFNLQRHKRPQIFMQSEVFIFSGQEWCHCISANDPTYDHFFVADCFFLYNKTEPGPELLHSARLTCTIFL